MYNKTSATLMLQTIMVLMEKQNISMDATNFPVKFSEEAELEKCYGPFGCFSIAYPWTENRPDNYFPESPETMGVRYPVVTRRNRHQPLILDVNDRDKIISAKLDSKGPFYVIAHGFIDSGDKEWIHNMADALLLQAGNADATVIVVDWRGGSQPPYGQAVANIRLVGAITALLIHNLYEVLGLSNLDNFHFIGHSLGAHLAGYCGHELTKRFGLKLGRITGLDPAAPHFSDTVTLVRLDRSDAKYVDIIHSNAMPLYYGGFGLSEPIGHVDFYPNGGVVQPGCKIASTRLIINDDVYQTSLQFFGCNHQRSYDYFTESIAPSCPFMAIQCDSYDSLLQGNCSKCDNKHNCVPMGMHSLHIYKRLRAAGLVNTGNSIQMYAMTGHESPFCRVHYKVTVKMSESEDSIYNGPEIGKLQVAFIDKNGKTGENILLNEEKKYYKPGATYTSLITMKGTGNPPVSVNVNWIYKANLFDLSTWRLRRSSSVYIEYMKISSIEYNTDLTVCPQNNTVIVQDASCNMKPKYCSNNH